MNPTAAPTRTDDQRMEALLQANMIRRHRAILKARLKRGELDALAIIAYPPKWTKTMRVRELLLALPKYGPVKVDRLMRSVQIAPGKTLAGLSARQRGELLGELS